MLKIHDFADPFNDFQPGPGIATSEMLKA